MRTLVLLLTLAGTTLHAIVGCGVFHAHAGEAEHNAQIVESTHEHTDHSDDAPPAPCEGPSAPENDCDTEPCVYANGVRVNVFNLFVSVIAEFFEPSAPATAQSTIAPRIERVSSRLGSPLRSHLLLGVLLL